MTGSAPNSEPRTASIYRERAQLAAAFAKLAQGHGHTAVVGTDPQEPDWPVLYVNLPTGQVSWHFSPDDADLLDGFERVAPNPWDGHSVKEKYARLAAFGMPVVERDPAAELAAAVKRFLAVQDREAAAYTGDVRRAEKFQYETQPAAENRLRAALAAYEASRK